MLPRRGLRRRAHPRSRGENGLRRRAAALRVGSSPLTRGKRSAFPTCSYSLRLIPAHAGKTSTTCGTRASRSAHPRSRGENYERKTGQPITSGSSPLTRGKQHPRQPRRHLKRLIPAHAGKTRSGASGGCQQRAHPRSRGENRSRPAKCLTSRGSSPLTRGKYLHLTVRKIWAGLIPAHAGKMRHASDLYDTLGAHPRSRGENAMRRCQSTFARGSSPLTRGK